MIDKGPGDRRLARKGPAKSRLEPRQDLPGRTIFDPDMFPRPRTSNGQSADPRLFPEQIEGKTRHIQCIQTKGASREGRQM